MGNEGLGPLGSPPSRDYEDVEDRSKVATQGKWSNRPIEWISHAASTIKTKWASGIERIKSLAANILFRKSPEHSGAPDTPLGEKRVWTSITPSGTLNVSHHPSREQYLCRIADEHRSEFIKYNNAEDDPFVTAEELAAMEGKRDASPLSFEWTESVETGDRYTEMQDARFVTAIDGGVLAGVFDGHGTAGRAFAKTARDMFSKGFAEELKNQNGDFKKAFQELVKKIDKELKESVLPIGEGGCTAVLCLIDSKNNKIYTATLGDSEANIYRKNEEGDVRSIPLSRLVNWSHETEYRWLGNQEKPPQSEGKKPPTRVGINVSRAIGDYVIPEGYLSRTPKVTEHHLQDGDVLVLACDGLRDFVSEDKIAKEVSKQGENLAGDLVQLAKDSKPPGQKLDNVTVVAIRASRKSSEAEE